MEERFCRGKPVLFIPVSGMPRLPWAVVSGPLSNLRNPCKGAAARLVSWGPPQRGRAAQRGAEISCQAAMLFLGLSLAGVPRVFQAQGYGSATGPTLRMGRSCSRGQEGHVQLSWQGRRCGCCSALCYLAWQGGTGPAGSAAQPEPLGQHLVPGSFADLGAVTLWLINNSSALCSARSPCQPQGKRRVSPARQAALRPCYQHPQHRRCPQPGLSCLHRREGGGLGVLGHGTAGCSTVPGTGGVSGCWACSGRKRSWVLCLGWGKRCWLERGRVCKQETSLTSYQGTSAKAAWMEKGLASLGQSWVKVQAAACTLPPTTPLFLAGCSSLQAGSFPLTLRLLSMPLQEGFPKAPTPAPGTRGPSSLGSLALALCHPVSPGPGLPRQLPSSAWPLAMPEPHLWQSRGCGKGGW